jgi:uncharacterized membrane protein YgcG
MFASQSRARMMHLCSRLSTTRKGELTAVAYFSKMKGFVDEMVVAGKPLDDEDFVAYLLAGLDHDYNSFIKNVSARSDPMSISHVYAQFLVAESWLDLQNTQQQASVNATMHGGQTRGNRSGDGSYRGGNHGGRSSGGGRGGFGHGYGGRGEQNFS